MQSHQISYVVGATLLLAYFQEQALTHAKTHFHSHVPGLETQLSVGWSVLSVLQSRRNARNLQVMKFDLICM